MHKLLVLLLPLAFSQAQGQPAITGPTCVIPGATYQYLISGQWDSSSTMQVCTTGGVLALLNGPCTANTTPVSSLLIVWNTGFTAGSLQLTSSAGNTAYPVQITTPLRAGAIMVASRSQAVNFNISPAAIHCGADSGGSCKPIYVHQWQVSRDYLHWTDIVLATGNDLLTVPPQKQKAFFRRKTTETSSGSVAYSDIATVEVGPPPPGTAASDMN